MGFATLPALPDPLWVRRSVLARPASLPGKTGSRGALSAKETSTSVAVEAKILSHHRAKQGKLGHLPASAKLSDFIFENVNLWFSHIILRFFVMHLFHKIF